MSFTSVSVDASNLRAFLDRMVEAPEAMMRRFKSEAGEIAQEEMVRRAPFDRGFLSMLILIDDSFQDKVQVESTASYTKWLVSGTGVHGPRQRRIYPRNAKALSFMLGGRRVFFRSVAGIRPNPFIENAREAATPRIAELVQRIVSEVYI